MCKHVSSIMMKQRYGKIVNISSVVGVCGNAGQVNYSASKAGVIGITKSMAKELASRNIYVNAVAPGFINTNMTNVLSDKVKENINTQNVKISKDIEEQYYPLLKTLGDIEIKGFLNEEKSGKHRFLGFNSVEIGRKNVNKGERIC